MLLLDPTPQCAFSADNRFMDPVERRLCQLLERLSRHLQVRSGPEVNLKEFDEGFAGRVVGRRQPQPEKLAVQPQAHRQALRGRFREQTQSAANRVVEALGEKPGGRRIALLGGTGASNNLPAVIVLMNRAVNASLGIDSDERLSQRSEAMQTAIDKLDEIADGVEQELRRRLARAQT